MVSPGKWSDLATSLLAHHASPAPRNALLHDLVVAVGVAVRAAADRLCIPAGSTSIGDKPDFALKLKYHIHLTCTSGSLITWMLLLLSLVLGNLWRGETSFVVTTVLTDLVSCHLACCPRSACERSRRVDEVYVCMHPQVDHLGVVHRDRGHRLL